MTSRPEAGAPGPAGGTPAVPAPGPAGGTPGVPAQPAGGRRSGGRPTLVSRAASAGRAALSSLREADRWRRAGAVAVAATLDLLLPAVCPACRVGDGPDLCGACDARVPRLIDPCPRCAAPGFDGVRCRACRGSGWPHVARAHVACAYADVVEDLVTLAKAGARASAARCLAALLPDLPRDLRADAVVPVPPAPGRRPGPHLGTRLARALARRERLPFLPLLAQRRVAAEQHRLSYADRRRNVARLFVARAQPPPRVLLVDDLVTSGATASAAAAALRAAGAMRVELVCVARTPRHDERG